MPLNKETISQAIDKALEEVLNAKEKEETSDVIFDSRDDILDIDTDDAKDAEMPSPIEKTTPDLLSPAPSTLDLKVDEDVDEKVETAMEEAVDLNADYNFFGVDVKVEKAEDKFNIKMSKDGTEKTEVVDSLSFINVFGVIENFFNELVLNDTEDDNVEDEEVLEEVSDEVSEEVSDESTEEVDLTDDEIKAKEDEEEEKELHASLSNLRKIYSHKIDEYFEHGIMAKELALTMVKEKIVASTVKDLISKTKEKDSIIASKKDDLKKASQNYVLVSKKYKVYTKAVAVLSSAIKELKTNLGNGKLKKEIADKAIKKYNFIIANIIKAKKSETILAEIKKVDLVKNAIVASMKKYEKETPILANNITNNKINKRFTSINNSKNILNSDGWNDNKTILANRYDGIEEMSSELLRIAGI